MGVVGLAVVGLGRMGRLYVDVVARFVDGVRLVGVFTRTFAKAEAVAREYGVKAYRCLDELLRDPDVDGVIIATPTYTHADFIVRVAEVGKHVFCEKPIDVDLVKAKRAVEVVERCGVKLLVGYMRRFDRAYRRAKEVVERGEIGEPLVYIGVSRDPEAPPEGWLRDPRLSGGLVLDLMSHDFDLARWFLGDEVVEVYAHGGVFVYDFMRDLGDFDTVVAYLRFSRGKIAVVYGSRRAPHGYDIRCEVHGTEGSISIGVDYDYSVRLATSSGVRFSGLAWFQERFFSAYVEEIKHFRDVIRYDIKPLVSGYDAIKALEIAQAVTRSIIERRPIAVS